MLMGRVDTLGRRCDPHITQKIKTGSSPFATEHPNHWNTLTMEVTAAL